MAACSCWRATTTAAQSSTLPHQSEQVFSAAMIPVSIRRTCRSISTSACWALRCRATRAAGSASRRSPRRSRVGASVWVDPERIKIIMPTDFQLPPGGLGIRKPDPPLEAEKRLHGPKMAAVKAFVRANGFDRTVIDPPRRAHRHHDHGQGLSRHAPGPGGSRHQRGAREGARHPPLQGRHDLAARAGRRAPLRRGPAGSDRRRGEALQPRGPARPPALQHAGRPPAAGDRQGRRDRPASSCRAKASSRRPAWPW